MPKIPIQEGQLSPDVAFPTSSSAGSGLLGASVSNFGETIANTSLGLLKEFKQQEAESQAHAAVIDDSLDSQKIIAEYNQKYPTGYVTDETGAIVKDPITKQDQTVSELYGNWAKNRFEERQQQFSSALGQSIYVAKASSYFADNFAKVRNQQLVNQANSFKTKLIEKNQEVSLRLENNSFAEAPNPSAVYEYTDELGSILDRQSKSGDHTNALEAKKINEVLTQNASESFVKGMLSSSLYTAKIGGKINREQNVNNVLNILEEKDDDSVRRKEMGLPTVASMLGADGVDKYKREALGLLQTAKDLNTKSVKANVEDTATQNERIAEEKGNFSKSFQNTISVFNDVASLKSSGKITDTEAQRLYSKLFSSLAGFVKNDQRFILATPSQRAEFAKQWESDNRKQAQALSGNPDIVQAGAGFWKDANKKILSIKSNYDSLEKNHISDFMGLIKNSKQSQINGLLKDPTDVSQVREIGRIGLFNQALTEAKNRLAMSGNYDMSNIKPLSSQAADKLALYLTDKNRFNSDQKAALSQAWKQSVSPEFFAYMTKQLQGGKKTKGKEHLTWFGYATDLETASAIAKAQDTKESDLDEVLRGFTINGKPYSAGEINEKVDAQFSNWASAVMAEQDDASIDKTKAFKASARLQVKHILSQNGMSLENAMDSVKNSIIDKRVHVVDFDRGSFGGVNYGEEKSYFLFPKKIDGIEVTPEQISGVKDSLSEFRNPEFLKSIGVVPTKQLTPLQEEQWYKVTAASLQPVRSSDHTGINFKYYDQVNSRPYTALKIRPFSSTDKRLESVPFYVSFEDLASPGFIEEFKKKHGVKLPPPIQWKRPGEQ